MQLTGGSGMIVFTPFTDAGWVAGDVTNVVIVSPVISGVTPQTTQIAARGYMEELQSQPDNILVTLMPAVARTALMRDHFGVGGIADQTLFVWADHINSINFAPAKDDLVFLPPIVTFLVAFGFFIASMIFKRRATRL